MTSTFAAMRPNSVDRDEESSGPERDSKLGSPQQNGD